MHKSSKHSFWISLKTEVASGQTRQRTTNAHGQCKNNNTSTPRQIWRKPAIHKEFECEIPQIIPVRKPNSKSNPNKRRHRFVLLLSSLFADGGNFSSDEIDVHKKKLEKMAILIDKHETAVLKEMEKLEKRQLEEAIKILGQFQEKYTMSAAIQDFQQQKKISIFSLGLNTTWLTLSSSRQWAVGSTTHKWK